MPRSHDSDRGGTRASVKGARRARILAIRAPSPGLPIRSPFHCCWSPVFCDAITPAINSRSLLLIGVGHHLYGRSGGGQQPPGARPGDTHLCSVGSRLRRSGMLGSSATGTLGEHGFQSDCISFGAGGRRLDQVSLRMRSRSLAALMRRAVSTSIGNAAQ